jgi:choline kinase
VDLETIKCVILAAGASTRLRPLTASCPKCLLEVQGKTILERTIEQILAAGIGSIAVVIGYRGEMIREFLKARFPERRFRFILNPNYESTNNAYSLLLARHFLENKEEVLSHKLLLLDSDIVFSSRLLPVLLNNPAEDKLAVRVEGEHDLEEIRVRIAQSQIIAAIGKEVPLDETYGESIGIEFFSVQTTQKLFPVLQRRIKSGQGRTEFYETAFQELIEFGERITAVDIGVIPTIEIDTPEDFVKAQQLDLE